MTTRQWPRLTWFSLSAFLSLLSFSFFFSAQLKGLRRGWASSCRSINTDDHWQSTAPSLHALLLWLLLLLH